MQLLLIKAIFFVLRINYSSSESTYYLFIIIIIINYLSNPLYRVVQSSSQIFQAPTLLNRYTTQKREYPIVYERHAKENDSRCLSRKGSFHRMGPYVTRLFFAINGPTRVHEEDEFVKRLDNEVEVSIEARDKSQGQPGDRHRGEVDDYRGGGFSRLEGRFSPRESRPPSFYAKTSGCSIIFQETTMNTSCSARCIHYRGSKRSEWACLRIIRGDFSWKIDASSVVG